MGLSVRDITDMTRLAALAADPKGTSREEIYLAVASLFRTQGPYLTERERDLMCDILRMLTRDVEMAIRISLAERLADDPNAPEGLVHLLVDDKIEVARPVILRSKTLTDEDILEFIETASEAHQAAFAERPNIGEPVTARLARSDAESVLMALVRNVTARIAHDTFETLVEKSRIVAALQAPLVERPDLPSPLASRMCEWVSDTLKTYIATKYDVAPGRIAQTVEVAATAVQRPSPISSDDPARGAQKLIEKMAIAGQLKAGFLLRVLHQGQMDLFDLGFARLLNLPLAETRAALYERGPRGVALACRAAGIDRCVFSTVFNLTRQAKKMPPSISRDDLTDVDAIFDGSKTEALGNLQGQRAA